MTRARTWPPRRLTLAPGERALVPTGIALALPPGTVGLVHPRSGLAARHGISIVNAPGTIDSGYRGEILVNLINLDPRERVHHRAWATGSPSSWSRGRACRVLRRPTRSPRASGGTLGTDPPGDSARPPDHRTFEEVTTVSIFRRRKADAETAADGGTETTIETDVDATDACRERPRR